MNIPKCIIMGNSPQALHGIIDGEIIVMNMENGFITEPSYSLKSYYKKPNYGIESMRMHPLLKHILKF